MLVYWVIDGALRLVVCVFVLVLSSLVFPPGLFLWFSVKVCVQMEESRPGSEEYL